MSYRIFVVSPSGETRERRHHSVPVAVERRKHTAGAPAPSDVEWDKLRERLRDSESPRERAHSRHR
jgi:hypothetical protein